MSPAQRAGLAGVACVVGASTACDCPTTEGIPEGVFSIANPPDELQTDDLTVTIEDGVATFRYTDAQGVHEVQYAIVLEDPIPEGSLGTTLR